MKYLALGDSMSIDLYTGVKGGGAACRFAEFIAWNVHGRRDELSGFLDLTRDGWTTVDVLRDLEQLDCTPDVVTLTTGGNDLLLAALMERRAPANEEEWAVKTDETLARFGRILDRLHRVPLVIANTVYDPSDGDDGRFAWLGLDPLARRALERYNSGVFRAAAPRGVWVADLAARFRGHGFWSEDPWLAQIIEPNLRGAAEIACSWCDVWNRFRRRRAA